MDISGMIEKLGLPPELLKKVEEFASQQGIDLNNIGPDDQQKIMGMAQQFMGGGGGNPLDKIQDMTEGTPIGNILEGMGFGKDESPPAEDPTPSDPA
ncbi:MAG: hypothetical protein MUC92_02300 [Fimbriimonadaceae bacterium]|jgi:hypothetical protein|nr:hypothetical protein [Fimbriimonadaceae bacterium]